jgi:hypothetical protein
MALWQEGTKDKDHNKLSSMLVIVRIGVLARW